MMKKQLNIVNIIIYFGEIIYFENEKMRIIKLNFFYYCFVLLNGKYLEELIKNIIPFFIQFLIGKGLLIYFNIEIKFVNIGLYID